MTLTLNGSRGGPIVKRADAKSDRPSGSGSPLLGHTAPVTIRTGTVRAADRPDMALGSASVGYQRKSTECFFLFHWDDLKKKKGVGCSREHGRRPPGPGQRRLEAASCTKQLRLRRIARLNISIVCRPPQAEEEEEEEATGTAESWKDECSAN